MHVCVCVVFNSNYTVTWRHREVTQIIITCPRTNPSRRKRMTEKIDRQQGMVTPNSILNFCFLAVCVCVCGWVGDH